MVVVDSSALIPLSRIGRLELLKQLFKDIKTIEEVYEETVKESNKRGINNLEDAFKNWIKVQEYKREDKTVNGLSITDSKLIQFAEESSDTLITNDQAMKKVAETKRIEVYWLTTVIIKAVKEKKLKPNEAKEMLHELVKEGMNLNNKVYSHLLKKLEEID